MAKDDDFDAAEEIDDDLEEVDALDDDDVDDVEDVDDVDAVDDVDDEDDDDVVVPDGLVIDVDDEDDDDDEDDEDDEESTEELDELLEIDDPAKDAPKKVPASLKKSAERVTVDEDEFICQTCFLVKSRAQMMDTKGLLCRDCA